MKMRGLAEEFSALGADNPFVGRLAISGNDTAGNLSPRGFRTLALTKGLMSFTTTVRMVDSVHGGTKDGRATTEPAGTSGLTDNDLVMIDVRYDTDGSPAFLMDAADFSGRKLYLGVIPFLGYDGSGGTCRTNGGSSEADDEFDVVDLEAYRNVSDKETVACDRLGRFGSDDGVSDLHVLVCENVAAFAVTVADESNVPGAVWIVFDGFDLCWDFFLIEGEVDHAVELLMTAALVANGDAARIVAAGGVLFIEREGLIWFGGSNFIERVPCHFATARSCRVILLDRHTLEF